MRKSTLTYSILIFHSSPQRACEWPWYSGMSESLLSWNPSSQRMVPVHGAPKNAQKTRRPFHPPRRHAVVPHRQIHRCSASERARRGLEPLEPPGWAHGPHGPPSSTVPPKRGETFRGSKPPSSCRFRGWFRVVDGSLVMFGSQGCRGWDQDHARGPSSGHVMWASLQPARVQRSAYLFY